MKIFIPMQKDLSTTNLKEGFALMDVLLGAALLVMLISFIVPAFLYGEEAMQLSGERQRAVTYAEEGLEAVRNIRDNSFADLVNGTYGLATSTNSWTLSGTNNINGEFTRQISISSGSTTDRKIINSLVTWNQNLQRTGSINLVTNLDNWAKTVTGPITIVGSASNPADNGTLTGPTAPITPPTGMQTGDVIVIIAMYRGAVTPTIVTTGGQTWTSLAAQANSTTNTSRIFYAVYNGTWTANPVVSVTSGALGLTAVMHVFRNVDPSVIDVAQVATTFAAPASPFNVTIASTTTLTNGSLVLAVWTTLDDNTWGLQTAGWTNVGLARYRNLGGSDLSISTAYKIMAIAGSSGSVINRQLTLGGDAGVSFILTLKQKP